MNYKKKLWLGCSVLALAGHAVALPAVVTAETWQARQLHEVIADVVVTEENAVSYSVKYGDTLSVISEAMNIELRYLASINNIADVDLIFPETVLTAQFDDNNHADTLTVESPDAESIAVNIPVNLSPIETIEEAVAVESGNNDPVVTVPEVEVGAPTPEELPEELPEETVPAEELPEEPEAPSEDLSEESLPEEDLPIEELPEETLPEEPIIEEPIVEEPAAPAPELNGLAYHAAVFRDEVVNMFGVTAYGIRPGDSGDHGSGLAVDFMVPVGSDIGDAIANYAINNMGAHNISYIIWEQQIYGGWTGGWETMEDRGSVTANHYDHVHVSFY